MPSGLTIRLVNADEPYFACTVRNDTQQFLEKHADSLSAGQLFIDVATTPPDDAARLGVELLARGVDYLESPFVASSDQTRSGQGVALVAGSQGAFLACADLYDAIAPTRYFAGAWGSATKTKLVSNLILGLNRAALAEGLLLAEALQLDMPSTLEVLRGCNSYSGVMDTKGEKMIARDFATQARLSQHAKDVKILLEQMVRRGGHLPFSELHLSVLQFAEEIGLGALDNSAIVEAIARFGIHRCKA